MGIKKKRRKEEKKMNGVITCFARPDNHVTRQGRTRSIAKSS